jgi:hypothetical protein
MFLEQSKSGVLVTLLNVLASILNGLNGAYALHFLLVIIYYLKLE